MGYFMFDKRRLAGDAADPVCQGNRVIVHRRQAASHGPMFAARQRYFEDVVEPPTAQTQYAFADNPACYRRIPISSARVS